MSLQDPFEGWDDWSQRDPDYDNQWEQDYNDEDDDEDDDE